MHTLMYTLSPKKGVFRDSEPEIGVENKKSRQSIDCQLFSGEPAGARTQDPNIKSVVLYLLSYGFSGQTELRPDLVVQM